MSIKSQQLFFHVNDREAAVEAATKCNCPLYVVVDKRSKNPKPLMLVLGIGYTAERLQGSSLWKRMWTYRDYTPALFPLTLPKSPLARPYRTGPL